MFLGRTDVEAETPICWSPHAESWLIGKDPDAGKDWGQKEKGTTEDEMVGWHHRLDGHGFGWTPGVGDGQGGLVCCSPWGRKESDTTERLNWTELNKNCHAKIRGAKQRQCGIPTIFWFSLKISKILPKALIFLVCFPPFSSHPLLQSIYFHVSLEWIVVNVICVDRISCSLRYSFFSLLSFLYSLAHHFKWLSQISF